MLVCLIQQTRHLVVVCMGDPNCMEFGAGHSYKRSFGGKTDSSPVCRSILMSLKGTSSGRTAKYAKQQVMTTGSESNLTLALGYSRASWEVQGMYGCMDFPKGFSLTILFEPGWHWGCCYSTATMKHSGQVLFYLTITGEGKGGLLYQITATLLSRNICSVEHCHANQYVLVLYCVRSYPLTPLEQGLIK